MQTMTIQQAAEATGWSQRMLRYLEQAGLVAALVLVVVAVATVAGVHTDTNPQLPCERPVCFDDLISDRPRSPGGHPQCHQL
jgi:hypothetical protein